MLDFNKYFNEEYQFALNNVSYAWIESNNKEAGLEINIRDKIDTDIQDKNLKATFERKVYFNPEALFTITVTFAFTLKFRESVNIEEIKSINWSDALIENANPYLSNIISRTSSLIAALTSSYGQQPLITPPNIIRA